MIDAFMKGCCAALAVFLLAGPAAVLGLDGDAESLDSEVQDLKGAVLDLNRELFMLEEELLYPANTQVAVFLSMDIGEFFALDSVQRRGELRRQDWGEAGDSAPGVRCHWRERRRGTR